MLVYMGIQMVLPIVQLPYRYHTPLGWKMFAYYGPEEVDFRAVYHDGTIQDSTALRKTKRLPQTLRPEVDRARFVPPAVCLQVPSVRSVEYRRGTDMLWHRFECR